MNTFFQKRSVVLVAGIALIKLATAADFYESSLEETCKSPRYFWSLIDYKNNPRRVKLTSEISKAEAKSTPDGSYYVACFDESDRITDLVSTWKHRPDRKDHFTYNEGGKLQLIEFVGLSNERRTYFSFTLDKNGKWQYFKKELP